MKFINLHTHKFSSQVDILEIVNQYPNEFDNMNISYSMGIHPWKIDKNSIENDLQIINQHLKDYGCLALGECGLDKRIETSIDLQIEVFEKQLALAIKHHKPIILHCVGAFQEIIEIKNRLKIEVPIIVHGFSKNIQIAKQLLNNGFYLSFGKYLMQNTELENVFKEIPLDCLFLETDTSDFNIEDIYKKAAILKNIELEILKKIIFTNFKRVFELK